MTFHPKRGLRKAFRKDEILLGMFSRTGCGDIIEMAGQAGVDFVVIDAEHGCTDSADVRDLVCRAECAGLWPVVRPYANDPQLILRALDAGAVGVLVPHVKSREDAERAVKAAKFFPQGERARCEHTRAFEFGRGNWLEEDRHVANDEIAVLLEIEDAEGVANMEEIAAVPGVDVLFIGAGDLSASLGATRDDPRIHDAIAKSVALARLHGISAHVGISTDSDTKKLEYWYKQGCRSVHVSDVMLFASAINGAVSTVRQTVSRLQAAAT